MEPAALYLKNRQKRLLNAAEHLSNRQLDETLDFSPLRAAAQQRSIGLSGAYLNDNHGSNGLYGLVAGEKEHGPWCKKEMMKIFLEW